MQNKLNLDLSCEYNEYVVGYVVTDKNSGRSVNYQFDKFSPCNHPRPAIQLQHSCEGDDTAFAFDDDELEYITKWLRTQKEPDMLEDCMTEIEYNEEKKDKFLELSCKGDGIRKWDIIEIADI